MAFRFLRTESIEDGLHRIAHEQVAKTLSELDVALRDPLADAAGVAIHSMRKRCKKLRALIRIVRPGFPETYKSVNATLRDGARYLSPARDAAARLACFDALVERYRSETGGETFARWREALDEERCVLMQGDVESPLRTFGVDIEALRDGIDAWHLKGDGTAVLFAGYRITYRLGRRAMEKAYADSTPQAFHEWRKRVKYHRYQVRLLRNVWKSAMGDRRRAMHDLSTLLGDDHDLAVLSDHLREIAGRVETDPSFDTLLDLVERRRAKLEKKARSLGRKLYTEKPGRHVKRVAACWRTWRRG